LSRRFDYIILKGRKKIRDLFFRNTLLKLMALAITLFFWFTAIGSKKIDIVKKVPVTYITTPEIVVTNEIETDVELKLSGPRAFIREIMDREDTITIDLRDKKPGYITYKIYDHMIELPIGVKVVGIYPESITPKIELLKAKMVEVHPSIIGELPEGYKLRGTQIEPDKIEVSGAQSVIDNLDKVFTEPVDISSLTNSITMELNLDMKDKKRLHTVSSSHFSAFIDITPILSKRTFYNVKIELSGYKKYKVIPESFTATIEGPQNTVDRMTQRDLNSGIDISNDIPGTYMKDIVLRLPESVKPVSIKPAKVKILIF
jgi:YbbR domain-containing protein